jgi:hypothetical protein
MALIHNRSLYIGKYPPPPGGGGISANVIWGKKTWKGEEKKGENVKEKGRTGKENEKKGSKRVKLLQNREELRQKGHNGSRKTMCRTRGKKYHFQRGGGINIVFGPKYRPLIHNAWMFYQWRLMESWGPVVTHGEQCWLIGSDTWL